MSRSEVQSLAQRHGVREPHRVWYSQGQVGDRAGAETVEPGELDFVDFWFDGNGRLVAYQTGNFIAFTTGMEFDGKQALCSPSAPASDASN